MPTSEYKRCGSERRVYVSSQRTVAAGDIDAGCSWIGGAVYVMSWAKLIGMGFALRPHRDEPVLTPANPEVGMKRIGMIEASLLPCRMWNATELLRRQRLKTPSTACASPRAQARRDLRMRRRHPAVIVADL